MRQPLMSQAFIRLLVLAAVLWPISALAEADVRLGDDVVPTSQSIELELDAAKTDYRGAVRIALAVKRETDRFRLHSEGLTLESVVLTGAGGVIAIAHRAEGDDLLWIESETPLAPGDYTLEIAFTHAYNTRAVSLYRMQAGGDSYLFTQFEVDDAREAFPCWDEPAFKIPYQLTLKVPEAHLAITNTPVEKETVEDGWRTTLFAASPPLPSYLLAIAAGPLETVPMPGLGVPGRLVTVRGQSHLTALAAEVTPPILKALEQYFGRPYPYRKLDFLALPEFWPGAMENPGAVTYADRILLLDPAAAAVSQRRLQALVIAHELAHMWFGDLVTMEWWNDLWLNEAFATWMAYKIVGQVFPEFGSAVEEVENSQGVLTQDSRSTSEAIRRPVTSTKNTMSNLSLTYQKGRAVLGMFERWVGPEAFRRAVTAYVDANAWDNATAEDLWRSVDKVSGKGVAAAMATFFDQPGFPLIDVELLADGRVKLSQERFRNHGSESADLVWQVPVTLKYSHGDGVRETTLMLDQATQTVSLGERPPAWVFPNASANGFYRWRLPADQLLALAGRAGDDLTARERVELIGNVSALLAAGSIRGDQYLSVLSEVAGDADPLVVGAVLSALETVKTAFVPAELEDAFAGYLRRTLGPAMDRFGLEKAAGEAEAVSLVRPDLYAWLGREGRDDQVLQAASALAASYLEDPASVDGSLAAVALELAAARGDRKLFDEYTRRLESAASPAVRRQFLDALGAFRDPALRRAALSYALTGPLRPNEIFVPGRAIGNDAAGRDLTYGWLTESYDALAERLPPQFKAFMPFLASGCSAQRLERATVFFAEPAHQAPGTEVQLAKVAEQVRDCVALREREGEAVARYLRGESPGDSLHPIPLPLLSPGRRP